MAGPIKYTDLFDPSLGPGAAELVDFTKAVQGLGRNYRNFAKSLDEDKARVQAGLDAVKVQAGLITTQATQLSALNEQERAGFARLQAQVNSLIAEQKRLIDIQAAQAKAQTVVKDATQQAQSALKAMQNELREAYAAQDTARAEKAAAAILNYKNQTTDLSRALRGTTSELTAARGSYDALVLENAKLIASLRGLKDGVDEGGEAAARLQKQIADNTQKLKTFDESILIFSRNVGNYKDGFGPLVRELAKLQAQQKGLSEDSQQYQALEQKRIGFLTAAQRAAAQAGLSYEQANAKITSYTAAIQPTVTNLVRLEQAQQEVAKSAGADSEEYRKLGFQIQATKRELEAIPDATQAAGKGFGSIREQLGFTKEGLVGQLTQLGVGLIGVQAIITGVGAAFATDSEFQSALSSLSALTGATGEDLQFLADKAEQLGPVVGKSAAEVLQAFEQIGSAKPELLDNSKALADFTEQTLLLAAAAKEQLPDAADALTGVMNQFQAPAEEAARYVNALAAGAKEGAATIPQSAAALKYFGVNAATANISVEKSVALIQLLAERSIKGEQAGTQLRNVLAKLASGAKETNPEVVGLDTALDNLGKQNLSTAQYTKLFGLENANTARVLVEGREKVEALTVAVTGTQVANEQAARQLDNIATASSRFGAVIKNVVINALDSSSRSFGRALNSLSDFIQRLAGVTKSFDDEVAASARAAGANITLAESSRTLLDRYYELTQKGVQPTGTAKKELGIITLQLRDALGESVAAIDKETGQLVLNTQAVEQAIKQKLLLANQEASSLALRAKAALDEEKQAQFQEKAAQLELATSKDRLDALNLSVASAQQLSKLSAEQGNRKVLGYSQEQQDAADSYLRTQQKITQAQLSGREASERYNKALDALKALGFNAADILNLFSGATNGAADAQKKLSDAAAGTEVILDRNAKALAEQRRADLQGQLADTEKRIADIKKLQAEQGKLFENKQIGSDVFRASVATTQDQITELERSATATRIGILRAERDEKLITIADEAIKSKKAKNISAAEIADIEAAAATKRLTVLRQFSRDVLKEQTSLQERLEVKPLEFKVSTVNLDKLKRDLLSVSDQNLFGKNASEAAEEKERQFQREAQQLVTHEDALSTELLRALNAREITQTEFDKRANKNRTATNDALLALDKKYHRADLDERVRAEAEKQRQRQEAATKRLKLAQYVEEQIGNVGTYYFQARQQNLDVEAANQDAAKENELKAAGENEELKAQITAKYAKLEAKRKHDQAVLDRQNALFQIALNTAMAVTSVLSTGGGTRYADFGISAGVLSAIVIANGLLQAGLVLSKPLPQYYKGRKGGPAELAQLAERGPELVGQEKTGFRLVAEQTVGYLAAGDRVYTAPETKQILAQHELVEGRIMQRTQATDMELQTTRLRTASASHQAAQQQALLHSNAQVVQKLEQVRRAIQEQEYNRLNEQGDLVRRIESEGRRRDSLNQRYRPWMAK